MIKKININNLGLYQNFVWNSIVRDKGNNPVYFKKENIIYGRNYSGKTTLSRIIRALETKEISPKYINPEFQIVLDNNTIDQNNFQANTLNVRCFNEDFIKENLRFIIDPDSEIKPFAILGENAEIEAQIETIKGELGENKEDLRTLKYKDLEDLRTLVITKESECSDLKRSLESQLTTKATGGTNSIKQQHAKFGDISYNITKLNRDIGTVLDGSFVSIDSSKEALNLQQIKEVQKTNVTKEINFINIYNQLLPQITDLINQLLLDGNKIAELLADSSLNEWVKKGYELHSDNRNCDCKFCGNPIQTSRWEQLDNHFDEESKKLEGSLMSYTRQIETELVNLETYNLPGADYFYMSFHEELAKCTLDFNGHIENYKTDLKFLLSKINERLAAIHSPVTIIYSETFSEEGLLNVITSYNELRDKNNAYSDELIDKINESKEELRLLEVKRFVDTIQYATLQANINAKESYYNIKRQERVDLFEFVKQKEKEIEDLSRQLNNEEEGARRVNDYLQNYFGHQNLELQAIEEEIDSDKKIRFNIVRNRNIAYHLSEGECSIISFCYFMAKLDDIHTAGQKPIILIDDPISSLDSNHIFYIYSLINNELFIKQRFEQIFISTHNLEFFKYLKMMKFSKINKELQNEFFIINRFESHSTINLMPSYLKDYVTEFNYLFHQLYKCANHDLVSTNHDVYFNFGNNLRKFLEVYLFYKYPSKLNKSVGNSSNNKRLVKFFGENQNVLLIERITNEYSHLEENSGRSMEPIDVPEMKNVAEFVLNTIKVKDIDQYNALLESIGIEAL